MQLDYYPNSHAYKINGDRKIGISTVGDTLDKPGLKLWPRDETLKYLRRAFVPQNNGKLVFPQTIKELEALFEVAGNQYNLKRDKGADTGTAAHAWLEEFLTAVTEKRELPQFPEDVELPTKDDPRYSLNPWLFEDETQSAIEVNNLNNALKLFVAWFFEEGVQVVHFERIVYSKKYDFAGRFDAIFLIKGKLYMVDFKTNNPSRDFPNGIFPEMFCQVGGYDLAFTEEFPDVRFDGHLIINFSKKTGKINRQFSFDVDINRAFFLHTLAAKRAVQHYNRELSMKYAKNRPPKVRKVK